MKKMILLFCLSVFILGCSNNSDDTDQNSNGNNQNEPTGVKLVFPLENSLCNEGINSTPLESTVLFEWERSDNANIYKLTIENLSTGDIDEYETEDYIIPITIKRAEAYRWFVAYDYRNETRLSAEWNFYNAGPGVQTYPPFPAEIISPTMAQTFSNTNQITLQWNGNDVDNDIVDYDIYFSNTNPPSLDTSAILENQLSVSVEQGTIYYWKVITKDAAGNSSDSGVYQFRILE